MTGDDTIAALELELAAEVKPHGNSCRFCEWLLTLPPDIRAWWDSKLWDGEDEEGQLVINRAFSTQSLQRLVLKKAPKGFPKSSMENHRKHKHVTPEPSDD